MTPEKLPEILPIARKITWEAGDILRAYYRGEVINQELDTEKDGPVTSADLAANHHILSELKNQLADNDIGYLSEETHQNNQIIPNDWVWIIDPLDGTRDFIDKTGEYAIHLALAYQGRPVLAIVLIPESEKLYFAIKDQGTFVENRAGEIQSISVSNKDQIQDLYLVVSRTHRDQRFQELIDNLPFKGKNYVGSVGCKIVTILEQQSDVYIALSGKSAAKDWDFAAPELILTEAGGKFSHFEGHNLTYNQGDVTQWGGILASNGNCHEQLAKQCLEILAKIDQH